MRDLGVQSWLVGKTHMKVDQKGMDRLGLSSQSVIGARVSECGFDVFERDDGLWAQGPDGFYDARRSPYNEYLKSKGYAGENPWHDYANSGVEDDNTVASGWFMKHADKPANIREEDSETPYMTGKAIEFMDKMKADGGEPWLCHLSYIKPHWPYIVPEPYHNMYGHNAVQPVIRDDSERDNPHPVYGAYMDNAIGKAFSRDEVREKVIPAYMGLIKQCDDQIGRLLDYMGKTGRIDDTMIVITSDHGDYLGDHWLGEKDLFHEQSVKVPMIIYDPCDAADQTRGTVCDALVESIDLVATFIETKGGTSPEHIVEGRSLLPFLHGAASDNWREFVVSEYDYSATPAAVKLGVAPRDARLFMIADKNWKFMHAEGGFRPMLFDLINDPQELTDLGADAAYANTISFMYQRLAQWTRRMAQRTTISDDEIIASRGKSARRGVLLGVYDEADAEDELTVKYRGKAQGRSVAPG